MPASLPPEDEIARLRVENDQGASSGPGSQASPEAPSDLRPEGFDPSRSGPVCGCDHCTPDITHASDCGVHSEPANACDCVAGPARRAAADVLDRFITPLKEQIDDLEHRLRVKTVSLRSEISAKMVAYRDVARLEAEVERLEKKASAAVAWANRSVEQVQDHCFVEVDRLTRPKPGEEWAHEMGDVLWWRFPIIEPPYCGSPNAVDWPGYHTHFTPIPEVREP